MLRTKDLLEQLDRPWLLDAEYQEWLEWSEQPYYESKQDNI